MTGPIIGLSAIVVIVGFMAGLIMYPYKASSKILDRMLLIMIALSVSLWGFVIYAIYQWRAL